MTATAIRDLAAKAQDWLLSSDEPGIRLQARRDLLDEEVELDADEVLLGPKAHALLEGQQPDGGFGGHPYRKWLGAHWRLVSLIELGVAGPQPRAVAAAETVLDWLLGRGHRANVPVIDGRARRCASQEGNALAVCTRLGMAADERVALLASSLIEWQWPDGGWNCDREPRVAHSSFNESLAPLWGLAEYAIASGDRGARDAAGRAAEFFLAHRVYRSHRTGAVGDNKWTLIHYPAYWHYDAYAGLTMLARVGALPDSRTDDAIALVLDKRGEDGLWRADGPPYWRRSGESYRDPAPWERSGPNPMVTLNALRIMRAGGRI